MKAAIILFLLILFFNMGAQNLVPNPSFEDTVSCPTNIGQLAKAKFWINPTQTTPDYYNSCNQLTATVPDAAFGYQLARTGHAYAGFYCLQKPYVNAREYVETSLVTTLSNGHKYLVSFYVNLSNVSEYSLSSIGAYFSSTPISNSSTVALSYVPQIQNNSSFQLSDSLNWMLISDTLVSNGTEQYMTIGNFNSDNQSDTVFLGNFGGGKHAYYYIDDVSVIDVQDLGINKAASIGFKIFPNPANSILNIEARLQDAQIKIYDVLGNELLCEMLSYKKQVDISDFRKGIYLLRLQEKGKIYTSKFVKE